MRLMARVWQREDTLLRAFGDCVATVLTQSYRAPWNEGGKGAA